MRTLLRGTGQRFLPPQLPSIYLPRPDLCLSLRAGFEADKRITTVTAGPGSGKTSLLVEYSASRPPQSVVWIRLSPADRDPVVYFSTLLRALESRVPELGARPGDIVRTLGQGGLAQAMTALCDQLAATERDLLLICDGVEHLAVTGCLPEALGVLVDFFPETSQIVLAGRSLPPLNWTKADLAHERVALGHQDLCFDPVEVVTLARLRGIDLARDVGSYILERTRGWVTGVLYAFSGLATDPRGSLEQPDRLCEFLAREIFPRLSEPFRFRLLAASHCQRIDRLTCEALFGPDGGAFYAELSTTTSLAEPIGEEVVFYPMFRELLQRETRRQPAEVRNGIFLLLARHFTGQPDEMIGFLLHAGDLAAAEREFERSFSGWLRLGREATIDSILADFPESWCSQSAFLNYATGERLRLSGELASCLTSLDAAEDLTKNRLDLLAKIWGAKAAAFGARGEVERQREYAQRVLAAVPQAPAETRASCLNVLGMYWLSSQNLDQAEETFRAALAANQLEGSGPGQIRVLNNLGLVQANRGNMRDAIYYYRESIRLAEASGLLPLPLTFNNLALCHLYLGDLVAAWQAVEHGIPLCEQLSARRDRALLLRTLGQLLLHDGDLDRAKASFEESLAEATRTGNRMAHANAHFSLAEWALHNVNAPEAKLRIQRGLEVVGEALTDPDMLEAALLQAEALIGERDLAAAEEIIESATATIRAAPHPYRSLQLARLWRQLHLALGHDAVAAEYEREMASLCARHGYPEPPLGPRPTLVAAATERTPAIEIRAFGAFEVWIEGVKLPGNAWRSANAKVVLAYLLANDRGASKESLLELLYGADPPSRSALTVVVTRLRQSLEPGGQKGGSSRFILFGEARYFFNRGVHSHYDVTVFEQAFKQARQSSAQSEGHKLALEQAVTAYRGPYLDEFREIPWCEQERERLRRLALEAYEQLLALSAQQDDWDRLSELSLLAQEVDPHADVAIRVQIVALVMRDRSRDALRAGERFLQRLEEANLVPEDRTSELLALVSEERMTVRAARSFMPALW